jgi:hypothetical protein
LGNSATSPARAPPPCAGREAAQKTTLSGGPLREAFERIAKRSGRKIAKVAIARRILTLCYYGLRDGEIRCLRRKASARVVAATAA